MSIVVLESPVGQPAQFVNRFDEPIVFTENSTVSLVNLTVQLNKSIVVVGGVNDQCSFKLGSSGVLAVVVTATLTPGVYDPQSLASELAFQLNAAVNRVGSSWVVVATLKDNIFSGYILSLDVGFTEVFVPWDVLNNTTVTPDTAQRNLVYKDTGVDGWNASAYTSAVISRGSGNFQFDFVRDQTAACGVIAEYTSDPQPSD